MKSIVYTLMIFCLANPAALAAGEFKKGADLYAAGRYGEALPLLEQNAKSYPRYWPGHYYLAHTYLALGQKSAARTEYENCLTCQPGDQVSKSCRKVLTTLGGSALATIGGGTTLPPVDPLAEDAANPPTSTAAGAAVRGSQVQDRQWMMKATAEPGRR